MAEMSKLSIDALENATGGAKYTVKNGAMDYANVRKQPGLDSKVFFTIRNGQQVITTGKKVSKNGYVWYEIMLAGGYDRGWIAGSLIGL